ncbi:recombinase family protein [Fictibacillus sp. BK138]|uniref:recombinase family protein n=1 Tax=Fictibacillus sp. BK138 TaxID=2512121 RepID=UPI00102A9602|nr:recombinase family protein [Fictibacillus sp. BK138]RZT23133.1 DNA invertase Pin-like site-specific DNA recombinase [Fictibacillus sp. BK138]
MKYGYARVSSSGQDLTAQLKVLEEHGCSKIYKEKVSGKNKEDRTEFLSLLSTVREGDSIVVSKLDRYARSTKDALTIIEELEDKGVSLVVLNMGGDKLDTSTSMGKLMVTMLSGIAEFELSLIKERQREGIALAKQRGVYKGRPPKYTERNKGLQHAFELYDNRNNNGKTVKEICTITGISKATFHRKLRDRSHVQ